MALDKKKYQYEVQIAADEHRVFYLSNKKLYVKFCRIFVAVDTCYRN